MALAAAPLLTASAQTQAAFSLWMPSTNLQTGQYYDVEIHLDDADEVWVATVEISYNPQLVYVVGTVSGSPVSQGPLFGSGDTAIIRNAIENRGEIVYTISRVGQVESVSGSGVLGTFRIYPLQAGETQLIFNHARLTAVDVSGNDDELTVVPRTLEFTAALLDISITGDTVQPPPEATATPAPTEVASAGGQGDSGPPPQGPGGLTNVTAAPPGSGQGAAGTGIPLPILIIAGIAVLAGIGGVVLFVLWRRKSTI
jgi:hypothetical protein